MRFAFLMIACAAVAAGQPAPADLCSVEGQVVNSLTGEPVRGASVMLVRTDFQSVPRTNAYSASSNPSGHFALAGVLPGKYRLNFSRTGFAASAYYSEPSSRLPATLMLEAGQRVTDLVFRVTPNGVVSGRIVDENGDPIPYVQVQLSRFRYLLGRKQMLPAGGSGSTDDLGVYRIFDVEPGRYYLSAQYRQNTVRVLRLEVAQQVEEEYVPTFYPGVTDFAAAALLSITPGAQLQNVNLRLAKTRTVRVKGRVTPPNASLTLAPRNPTSPATSTRGVAADRDGNFEIAGVVPGAYYLMANVMQSGKPPYSTRQPLDVGPADIQGIAVSIPPPAETTGRFRAEGGKALPGGLRAQLTLFDNSFQYGPLAGGLVASDGTFKLENISLDRYYVSVEGLPRGWYVKSIRAGGTDALVSGLDATGGAPGPLDIVVSPNAGQVTGTAQDANGQQPAAGVTVALVPQEKERRERSSYYREARADEAGAFTFPNVIPGEYKVFAWDRVESGAYMDPEFMKPVESKGEAVTVREGEKANVTVKVIPAGE
ncbi:MAG: carboxypeptidase-like regulatory domain-containing protein [Acidobacteriia bacterium]|nr:carboxypeptidase-like regulatory domain-containing protein [Terriglobia bacterium]